MPDRSYLDSLHARLEAFMAQHGILGLWHDPALFDALNELEHLIARERTRLDRAAAGALKRPWWAVWTAWRGDVLAMGVGR